MRIPNKLGRPSFQTAATFMTLTAMWLCCGCSDDFETPSQESGARLQFEANVVFRNGGMPGSRGTITEEVGASFGLLAGFIPESSDESETETETESEISADYIYNEECKRNADGKYSPNTEYRWVGNRKLKIFAYTPYNSNTEISSIGTPKLTYTVAQKVEDQEDLLVASCTASPDANGVQELNFSHALTAIRFAIEKDIYSINSISINGVYSKATTEISNDVKWGDYDENTKDFSLTFESGVTIDWSSERDFTADNNTFLMLPQKLPDGANIKVNCIDIAGFERELVAQISGTVWEPGTIITYHISTKNIYIPDPNGGYTYKPMF